MAADLTPMELTALKVYAGSKAEKVRDELPIGDGQPVDFIVHVSGALNVAGQSTMNRAVRPDAETLLAHVLDAAGPRKSKEIVRVVSALVGPVGGDPQATVPQPSPEAVGLATSLVAAVTYSQPTPKRGNVTGSLSAQRLK